MPPASSSPPPLHTPAAAIAVRPLWKTFLFFLAPMLLSNILQSLSGTLNNIYLRPDDRRRRAGGGVGLLSGDVLLHCLHHRAGRRRLGADRPGLGRARASTRRAPSPGTTLTVGHPVRAWWSRCSAAPSPQPMLKAAAARRPTSSADATRYARIILIAMPGLFVFLLSTAMLRGVGDTVTPLFTLVHLDAGRAGDRHRRSSRGWGGLPHAGRGQRRRGHGGRPSWSPPSGWPSTCGARRARSRPTARFHAAPCASGFAILKVVLQASACPPACR